MDQNESEQQVSQQPSYPALDSKLNPWIYVSICLFLILLGMGVFVLNQNKNRAIVEDSPSVTTAVVPTDGPPLPQGHTVFEDKRLEGMKFTYDTSRWDLIQFSSGNDAIGRELAFGGQGILLRDKQSQDKLVMKYTLPFGMGGGVQLVLPDRLVRLQNNLIRTRFKDSDKYAYGLDSVLVLFQNSQKDYELFVASCKAERETPGQQMQIMDTQDCSDLESKKAIGFLQSPTFQYSLRFRNLVNLSDIDPNWAGKDVNDVFENYVIVEVSYEGSNPAYADEIVQQIVK